MNGWSGVSVSSCFFWWLVCVCNKVRHVIEEKVCYLIYLRGRQVILFFGFERVLYSISKVPSGRYELISRYNPSIQMHEFLSWVKRATIWFFFFFYQEETCVAFFSSPWVVQQRPPAELRPVLFRSPTVTWEQNMVWPYMIHGSANALLLSRYAAVHCRWCLGVLCGGCGESRSSSLRSTMAAPGGDVSVGGRDW